MNPLNNIFGTYWSSASLLHRLDPRIKFTVLVAFVVVLFQLTHPAALALMAVAVAALYVMGRIPARIAWTAVAPLLLIVLGVVILNVFLTQGETVYAAWGPFCISKEGFLGAALAASRLVIMLFGTSLLLLTTTSLDVTDALANMLAPLSRIGVPVQEIALMMGIALRFLPQLAQEAFILMRAQANRGARFRIAPSRNKTGTVGVFSLVAGMLMNALRRVDSLADAMDARCYRGGVTRSKLNPLKLAPRDGAAALVMAAVFAATLALNVLL